MVWYHHMYYGGTTTTTIPIPYHRAAHSRHEARWYGAYAAIVDLTICWLRYTW